MKKSLWEAHQKELEKVICEWCNKEGDEELYNYCDENVCRTCLENEEYEESEIGLTNEERNR